MTSLVITDEDNQAYQHEEKNTSGKLPDSATSYTSYKKDESTFSESEPRVKFQAKKKRGGGQV